MSDQKLIIGYYRLSMEDDSEGESNSIINQRKLVKDYISNIPELAGYALSGVLRRWIFWFQYGASGN